MNTKLLKAILALLAISLAANTIATQVLWTIRDNDNGVNMAQAINEAVVFDPGPYTEVHAFVFYTPDTTTWLGNIDKYVNLFAAGYLSKGSDDCIDHQTFGMPVPYLGWNFGNGFYLTADHSDIHGGRGGDMNSEKLGLLLFYIYENPDGTGPLFRWMTCSGDKSAGINEELGDGTIWDEKDCIYMNMPEEGDWFFFKLHGLTGVYTIPEPATGLLALSGLVLFFRRRRR